jgi:hypothetical protein
MRCIYGGLGDYPLLVVYSPLTGVANTKTVPLMIVGMARCVTGLALMVDVNDHAVHTALGNMRENATEPSSATFVTKSLRLKVIFSTNTQQGPVNIICSGRWVS